MTIPVGSQITSSLNSDVRAHASTSHRAAPVARDSRIHKLYAAVGLMI